MPQVFASLALETGMVSWSIKSTAPHALYINEYIHSDVPLPVRLLPKLQYAFDFDTRRFVISHTRDFTRC